MKKLSKYIWIMLLPVFVLASCATGYVQKSAFSNGYVDRKLADDSYVVTFRANENTPPEEVMAYALKRAAEITRENGYRYFTVEKTVQPRRSGKAKEGIKYPSVRLYIKCSMEQGSHQIG